MQFCSSFNAIFPFQACLMNLWIFVFPITFHKDLKFSSTIWRIPKRWRKSLPTCLSTVFQAGCWKAALLLASCQQNPEICFSSMSFIIFFVLEWIEIVRQESAKCSCQSLIGTDAHCFYKYKHWWDEEKSSESLYSSGRKDDIDLNAPNIILFAYHDNTWKPRKKRRGDDCGCRVFAAGFVNVLGFIFGVTRTCCLEIVLNLTSI